MLDKDCYRKLMRHWTPQVLEKRGLALRYCFSRQESKIMARLWMKMQPSWVVRIEAMVTRHYRKKKRIPRCARNDNLLCAALDVGTNCFRG